MASSPPGGGWMPSAETLTTVGHGLLDLAGLIPIIGEPADIANAAWLAAEGNYLDAGLSLISVVPIVGDAIGKGGKVAKALGGKALGKVADLVRTMDFEKTLGKLLSHPKLAPYAKPIVDALNKWRDDLVAKFPACKPGGAAPCPLAKGAAKAGSDLSDFAVKGVDGVVLKAERVIQGTNGKVAVIGRSMGDKAKGFSGVRDYADELRKAGHDVELFDGAMIPDFAKTQMDILTNGGKKWLTNNEVLQTAMYQQNKAWAEKLVKEGYTVVDLGDFANRGFSPYYAIEKMILFGK